jgi:hypothetical protein
MSPRTALVAALVIAMGAGCGGGGGSPVAEESAPVQVAPKERPESTVAPRLEDLRPGFLPAGMEERAASDPGETGLLPPVSLGGAETPSAPVTTADATGSRFAHTWAAAAPSPDQFARAPMISVIGYPQASSPEDVTAGGGGDWVEAGPRRVYLAERVEPDGVSALSASWLEADVKVSAKARNVDRATFLEVIGALQAP